MPAPAANPVAWANDTLWTSGRVGEATKITTPAGVAEQGNVGDETFKGEYVNYAMNNFYLWLEFMRSEQGAAMYGDGSDGNVVIGAGTTTLARDMYYNDLTLGATSIVNANGFCIFVRGTLTYAAGGYIHNNGGAGGTPANNTTGGTAGAATAAGSLGASFPGGAGGDASTAGTAGTNATSSAGGAGGAGGASNDTGDDASEAGGIGGTATAPTFGFRHLLAALGRLADGSALRGGAGGGGGGGGDDGTGGGGGGGGGPVVVWARIAVLAGTGCIRADGGAGGAAYTGPDALGNGGGGGGGGGVVFFVCRQRSGTGTLRAAGGALGAGHLAGAAGVVGSAGRTFEFAA